MEIERFQFLKTYADTVNELAKADVNLAKDLLRKIVQYWIYSRNEKSSPIVEAMFIQIKLMLDKWKEIAIKNSEKWKRWGAPEWNKNAVKNKKKQTENKQETNQKQTETSKIENRKYKIENNKIENKKEENNSTTLNKISNEILIEEQKEHWNFEINELIKTLKEEAEKIWIAYDKTDERMFAKHILTAKEFWKLADRYGLSRIQFAVWIMKASIQINYRKGACSWPKKIYQNTAEVFNEAIRLKKKEVWNTIKEF